MKRRIVPGSIAEEAAPSARTSASFTPALHDHVDLDRRESGRERRVDALEHALDGERDVVDRLERLVVERVERDGHALQSGIGEALGLAREQRAVRRERDVGDAVDRHEALDETLELAPQQRLAARQAELLDAVGRERRRDALDLLEREQCGALEELEVLAEDLARHAVDAAEVAAVGDRDAEVTEAASEQVDGLCVHESMVSAGRLFQKPGGLGYADRGGNQRPHPDAAAPGRRARRCPAIGPGSPASPASSCSRCT